jgi:hypothetical protein
MPEQPPQVRRVLTSHRERKELLVLACEVDRAAWRQACRPARSRGAQLAHDLLGYLESFSSFFPGRVGRWLRGASFLTRLGRQFGWLRP